MSAYTGINGSAPIDTNATATLPSGGGVGIRDNPDGHHHRRERDADPPLWAQDGGVHVTPPGTDTERYDVTWTGQGQTMQAATSTQAGAGASGTTTATFTGSGMWGGLGATIAIAPATGVTPTADFTATPLTGAAPLSVAFTDTTTNPPTSWAWNFGDTGTSTSQNPTHNYATPGIYTVALTATNASGSDTETKTAYVTVGEAIVYAAGGGIEIY